MSAQQGAGRSDRAQDANAGDAGEVGVVEQPGAATMADDTKPEAGVKTEATEGDGGGEDAALKRGPLDHAQIGEQFVAWLNAKLARHNSPYITLGTKRARVVELMEDGRLKVLLETDGPEAEEQHVVFETGHLDELLPRLVTYSPR